MEYAHNQSDVETSQAYITTFIQERVPESDKNAVSQELKKTYLLNKFKSTFGGQKNKQRNSKKYITRAQKKALGLQKISRNSVKYTDLEPLHNLWKQYMYNYLDLKKFKNKIPTPEDNNWGSFSGQLLKADYHGAFFSVIRSTCPNLVGQSGICALDTKNTFVLVGKDNKTRTIPKQCSVFELQINHIKLTIFGKQFTMRSAERSTKKVKLHMVADI